MPVFLENQNERKRTRQRKEMARESERERERERRWRRRKRIYHKAILQYYVRTSAQWLLALVGVVSLDVPVRCTNRTKGRAL